MFTVKVILQRWLMIQAENAVLPVFVYHWDWLEGSLSYCFISVIDLKHAGLDPFYVFKTEMRSLRSSNLQNVPVFLLARGHIREEGRMKALMRPLYLKPTHLSSIWKDGSTRWREDDGWLVCCCPPAHSSLWETASGWLPVITPKVDVMTPSCSSVWREGHERQPCLN